MEQRQPTVASVEAAPPRASTRIHNSPSRDRMRPQAKPQQYSPRYGPLVGLLALVNGGTSPIRLPAPGLPYSYERWRKERCLKVVSGASETGPLGAIFYARG